MIGILVTKAISTIRAHPIIVTRVHLQLFLSADVPLQPANDPHIAHIKRVLAHICLISAHFNPKTAHFWPISLIFVHYFAKTINFLTKTINFLTSHVKNC